MKFIKIKTEKNETVYINVNLIISVRIVHPRPESTLSEIEVSKMATRYYVLGDISKQFEKAVNSERNGVIFIEGE